MIEFNMGKIVFDRRELASMLHGKDGMISKDLYKRALRVQASAKRQVGVRSGRLQRSIHIEMRSRPLTAAYVGSNVRYALLHHEGSRSHPIAAAPGRMLTFRAGGKRVHTRKVMHPGTKPNRYLTDNLVRAIR